MTDRKKATAIGLGLVALALAAGCASDAGPAFQHSAGPSADTGPVSASTTGGDAAGTFNLPQSDPSKTGADKGGH